MLESSAVRFRHAGIGYPSSYTNLSLCSQVDNEAEDMVCTGALHKPYLGRRVGFAGRPPAQPGVSWGVRTRETRRASSGG